MKTSNRKENTVAKKSRTTASLRDILFDEIEAVRGSDGDPKRAMAVANLSKQIISTAKVEMEFQRTMADLNDRGAKVNLGALALGTA